MRRHPAIVVFCAACAAGCSSPAATGTDGRTTTPPVAITAPPTTTSPPAATSSTTIICVENPQARQWAQQANSDTAAGEAIDQQLLRDVPDSEQYNTDYERVGNAELAISHDLDQLHAADNCGQYQSFTPT